MNGQTGTDSTGEWTPSQFAIDAGWDYTCIVATAEKGISETDAEGLTETQQAALLEYCQSRVAEREAMAAIEQGKSDDGEYVLAHQDGTRWDDDRYSDGDAALSAIKAWYDGVRLNNPGTDIIWHLMDCPVLAQMDDAGEIEIVEDEE